MKREYKNIVEIFLQRLEKEGIPTFSMDQKQLDRANEILEELVKEEDN